MFKAAPWSTVFLLVFAIITTVMPFISSKITALVIDALVNIVKTGIQNPELILFYAVMWGVVAGLSSIAGIVSTYIRRQQRYSLQTFIEFFMLKKRLSLDVGRYDDPDTQNLIQRAFGNRGYWPLSDLGTNFLPGMFGYILTLIIASFLIGFFDWRIYLLIVVTSIPGFIVDIIFGQRTYGVWSRNQGEDQRRYYDLREHVNNPLPRSELQLYQAGERFLKMIKDIYVRTEGELATNEKKRMYLSISAEILSAFGYGVTVFLIVQQVLQGTLAIGNMTFIVAAIMRLSSSIGDILSSAASMYDAHQYVTDIREFINTKSLIVARNPQHLKLTVAPEIRFENVSFTYPHQSNPVIKNMSFTISPGQKIGLVGNNGVGKSTLIKLLCRIYDPSEGVIYINGIDLKNIDQNEWFENLAVLMQDYSSYNFTVKDSITVSDSGKPYDDDRMKNSAKQSKANEFIEEWKGGYDEQLGKNFKGKEPSKGQRQKLALARTLYRKAHILLLDEPTAAVDAESEIQIFKTLDNYSKDVTAIYISHDFSTIRRADRIIVLEKGEIIEDGSHEELMATPKVYSRLFTEQVNSYTK